MGFHRQGLKLATLLNAPILLVDAPLYNIHGKEIVPRLAKDLIRYDVVGCEADAFRALVGNGYTVFELVRYLPDARQYAQQKIIAKVMADG